MLNDGNKHRLILVNTRNKLFKNFAYNRRQNTPLSGDECPNDFKLSNRKQISQLDVLPTLENLNKNTEDFQPSEVYGRR